MWQKKRNEVKGKSYHYSTINRLQKEKKIDEIFLSRINQLTLEELIAVKLEAAARFINHKLYGFPIWNTTSYIIKDSLIKFALSSTSTHKEAANLLGITVSDLKKFIKKYKVNEYFENQSK